MFCSAQGIQRQARILERGLSLAGCLCAKFIKAAHDAVRLRQELMTVSNSVAPSGTSINSFWFREVFDRKGCTDLVATWNGIKIGQLTGHAVSISMTSARSRM